MGGWVGYWWVDGGELGGLNALLFGEWVGGWVGGTYRRGWAGHPLGVG